MDFIEIVEMQIPISPYLNPMIKAHHLKYNDTICIAGSAYSKEVKSLNTIKSNDAITAPIKEKCATIDDFYKKYVHRTKEECYEEFMAPQRSSKWHLARKHAITASNFGSASGNNKYCSPKQCTLDKLWATFAGNEFTEYGTFHENDAKESFLKGLEMLKPTLNEICPNMTEFKLFEVGLIKSPDCPWMAVSPDGLLKISSNTETKWAVVEYKCPARLRDSLAHPYKSQNNVPAYYMDQIQGICGLLNEYPDILHMVDPREQGTPIQDISIQDIFFVVWQPHQYHITRIKFDALYYSELKSKLQKWFFNDYLPYAFLKHNDELENNSLDLKLL